jgi:hypothetical protein
MSRAAEMAMNRGITYLARYSHVTKEVQVCGGAILMQSDLMGNPCLPEDNALNAILVHELVHAIDIEGGAVSADLIRDAYTQPVGVAAALIEGHAQLQARAVCASNGWQSGFACVEGFVGYALPEHPSATLGARMARQMEAATVRASYVEGERFFAALQVAGGDALVLKALRAPPADMSTIRNPAWFVDPSLAPRARRDLGLALSRLEKSLAQPGWTVSQVEMSSAQFRASWVLLDKALVDELVDSITYNRSLVMLSDRADQIVSVTAIQFKTELDAFRYVIASEAVNKKKDDGMRLSGRLASAEYVNKSEGAWLEFFVNKRFVGAGDLKTGTNGVFACGKAAVEVLYANRELTADACRAIATSLLDSY